MLIKRLVKFGCRLFVSICFLVYLFNMVSWEVVWKQIKGADPLYLALYVILGVLAVLISSIKWLILSRAHGIYPPLSVLFSLYMVGYFFNNVLPTSVGGDVVRGYELGRVYGKRVESMASVFMERFTGYVTLVAFALLAIVYEGAFETDIRLVVPVFIAAAGALLILWAIVTPSWILAVQRRMSTNLSQQITSKLQRFQEALYMYKQHNRALLAAGWYSMLFYALSVIIVYVGCLTLHADVSIFSLITAVPVMLILFMIPVSLGGIGLQEWAYYFVLEVVGVPASVSLSLAILYRARSMAFGVIGGAIYPILSRESRVMTEDTTGG